MSRTASGDGYESAGKLDLALRNCQKAVEVGANNDKGLGQYKDHLKRLTEKVKAAAGRTAPQN